MSRTSLSAQYAHLRSHLCRIKESADRDHLSRWSTKRIVCALMNIERVDVLQNCVTRPCYDTHPSYRKLRRKLWKEISRRDKKHRPTPPKPRVRGTRYSAVQAARELVMAEEKKPLFG